MSKQRKTRVQETQTKEKNKMKKPNKAERRQRHLDNLGAILGIKGELLKVCYKSLKDIEYSGHKYAEKYCNGEIDSTQIGAIESKLKSNLLATLKYCPTKVVMNIQFNWDPRGHFLKFSDEYVRQNKLIIETDWGGYGILCPEGV